MVGRKTMQEPGPQSRWCETRGWVQRRPILLQNRTWEGFPPEFISFSYITVPVTPLSKTVVPVRGWEAAEHSVRAAVIAFRWTLVRGASAVDPLRKGGHLAMFRN